MNTINFKTYILLLFTLLFSVETLTAQNSKENVKSKVKTEEITYKDGEVTLNGVVYYPAKQKGKHRPTNGTNIFEREQTTIRTEYVCEQTPT